MDGPRRMTCHYKLGLRAGYRHGEGSTRMISIRGKGRKGICQKITHDGGGPDKRGGGGSGAHLTGLRHCAHGDDRV